MGGEGREVVDSAVYFQGDGERLSPAATIRRLAAFEARHGIRPDSYSLGGVVEEVEEALARTLGTEAALFLPTGTLANLLAITRHCGRRGQALVPAESHVYRDTGDGVARLGGIQMIPLAPDRPGPTVEEVRTALDRTEGDRVDSPPGVVLLESPVRRQMGRVLPFAELQAITALCRERGVPTHLDGARLFMMAAATGISVRRYCALFDTVYVSLCKYLGAPFGAVLAGSREFVAGLYHERRRFGGSLPGAWMAAALVLQGLEGFEERFGAAMAQGRELFEALNGIEGLRVSPLTDGSNIFPLRLGAGLTPAALSQRLQGQGIILPPASGPEGGPPAPAVLPLAVNVTILRRSNEALLESFAAAVRETVAGAGREPVTAGPPRSAG
ncbi:MAG TPA: aminotransferase class I/II-fold pyridoxal phosphate-dependent enzyme [Chloroflexota bacterium]|nr:aminotransferase class I/II-fold pyridoxal phosphate-dependent enzyme [Chloroflexota bacterium]